MLSNMRLINQRGFNGWLKVFSTRKQIRVRSFRPQVLNNDILYRRLDR